MMHTDPRIFDMPIESEIAEIVARASRGAGFMRAGEHAYRLWKTHPGCGLTAEELVDALVLAATRAGVAIEINRPQSLAA